MNEFFPVISVSSLVKELVKDESLRDTLYLNIIESLAYNEEKDVAILKGNWFLGEKREHESFISFKWSKGERIDPVEAYEEEPCNLTVHGERPKDIIQLDLTAEWSDNDGYTYIKRYRFMMEARWRTEYCYNPVVFERCMDWTECIEACPNDVTKKQIIIAAEDDFYAVNTSMGCKWFFDYKNWF